MLSLLVLQLSQVLVLALHDWVPLGTLNDLHAGRCLDRVSKRVLATLISTLPFAFGLAWSCVYALAPAYPVWLLTWLWWSYGILFAGELWAWWVPYLVRPQPERAARYQLLFGRTHRFLPVRYGIVPNTLHCLLHLATFSTLLLLWAARSAALRVVPVIK